MIPFKGRVFLGQASLYLVQQWKGNPPSAELPVGIDLRAFRLIPLGENTIVRIWLAFASRNGHPGNRSGFHSDLAWSKTAFESDSRIRRERR